MGSKEKKLTAYEIEKEEICSLRKMYKLSCNGCKYFRECDNTDKVWNVAKKGRTDG